MPNSGLDHSADPMEIQDLENFIDKILSSKTEDSKAAEL